MLPLCCNLKYIFVREFIFLVENWAPSFDQHLLAWKNIELVISIPHSILEDLDCCQLNYKLHSIYIYILLTSMVMHGLREFFSRIYKKIYQNIQPFPLFTPIYKFTLWFLKKFTILCWQFGSPKPEFSTWFFVFFLNFF